MARTISPKEQVKRYTESQQREPELQFIPSGSIMLNLAITETLNNGFPLGRISTVPGGSTSGKTILALSCLAECCLIDRLEDHLLIHDDAEERQDFNTEKLFGELYNRLQNPPNGISETVEDWQNNVMYLIKEKKSFIYILDSFDALSSQAELEKEMRRALESAKTEEGARKIAGSYNMEKAKGVGKIFRMIKRGLADTDSAVIVTQQIRQKINTGFGKPYTTSGGEAPFFYSHVRPWLTKTETLKKNGQKIGVKTKANIEKNSITGKLFEVYFDIFYDYGIDDIGSMIDFLLEQNAWKKNKKKIEAKGIGLLVTRDKLIREIESTKKLETKLRRITLKAWRDRSLKLEQGRKPRFRKKK